MRCENMANCFVGRLPKPLFYSLEVSWEGTLACGLDAHTLKQSDKKMRVCVCVSWSLWCALVLSWFETAKVKPLVSGLYLSCCVTLHSKLLSFNSFFQWPKNCLYLTWNNTENKWPDSDLELIIRLMIF